MHPCAPLACTPVPPSHAPLCMAGLHAPASAREGCVPPPRALDQGGPQGHVVALGARLIGTDGMGCVHGLGCVHGMLLCTMMRDARVWVMHVQDEYCRTMPDVASSAGCKRFRGAWLLPQWSRTHGGCMQGVCRAQQAHRGPQEAHTGGSMVRVQLE